MPSLASGNMSCTAWASTWAAECRMTLRPSFTAGRDGPDLGVDVGRPAQIPQLAVGVGHHHDRLRLAATG